MRAMLLHEPKPAEERPLELANLPLPEPGPGDIRLRVRVCGVCRTDLHTVEGDLPLLELPLVPGHQVVGLVEARGEGATRFTPGQRVGVPWLYRTCGKCEFCQRGLENLCQDARFTGLHADGGYAEAMVVPEDFAYPIPEGFSDIAAAPLLCAGIIGYRALRLSEIQPGQRLGLYGFGGSAHVTIQVARHWGCEVYVFTRSEGHRQLARELGAVWVGGAEETPPAKMHGSIIFAPAGGLVPEALRVLERGSTLSLAGVTMTPIPELDYDRLLYWERTVRSVANFTRQDAEELLQVAAEIPIHTTVQTFPLEAANQALLALKRSEIDGMGVLVVEQQIAGQ
ncbi:MAG: zinc-dependent alcohol dehydrogenase family protein [Chloroflexota bacterium]|nr:zinc-dependent alcohol dehydrogenase family protein [Chloroflexota bacterium]